MDKKSDNRESRRRFLKTAGKFAVYTPPALMVMSKSSHADFANSVNGMDAYKEKYGDTYYEKNKYLFENSYLSKDKYDKYFNSL